MQGQTEDRNWMMQAGIGAGILAAVGAGIWAVWYLNGINAGAAPTEAAVSEEQVRADPPDPARSVRGASGGSAPPAFKAPQGFIESRPRFEAISRQRMRSGDAIARGLVFGNLFFEYQDQSTDYEQDEHSSVTWSWTIHATTNSRDVRIPDGLEIVWWDRDWREVRSVDVSGITVYADGFTGGLDFVVLDADELSRIRGVALLDRRR